MVGIIDLHSHVLPGMDDGSDSLEMTQELLNLQKKQGVEVVCATPHYYAASETVDSFLNRREAALQKFQRLPGVQNCRVVAGAEAAFFSGISEHQQLDALCLAGTRTLLLEMPFSEWNSCQVEEVISMVLDRNYHLVLAHPERFLFSKTNNRYLEKLAELPISLQVNADTLIHWRTRRSGLRLLQMTNSPLLGSDCHNPGSRAPHLDAARRVIQRRLGTEFLEHMDVCAERAISDEAEVPCYA